MKETGAFDHFPRNKKEVVEVLMESPIYKERLNLEGRNEVMKDFCRNYEVEEPRRQ